MTREKACIEKYPEIIQGKNKLQAKYNKRSLDRLEMGYASFDSILNYNL
ncbi:MAG: hypothetical protein E6Y75_09390 [Anaerococcus sp.]|nr:hypothetical protein [Anaerococcus sp.]